MSQNDTPTHAKTDMTIVHTSKNASHLPEGLKKFIDLTVVIRPHTRINLHNVYSRIKLITEKKKIDIVRKPCHKPTHLHMPKRHDQIVHTSNNASHMPERLKDIIG